MSGSSEKTIILYRAVHLYLRYAEAVNRMGKPNLAYAVIKNGLGPYTMSNDDLVPRHEKYISDNESGSTFYSYCNFQGAYWLFQTVDDNGNQITTQRNIGVHGRGCGNIENGDDFKIPVLNSLEDSITYVEDAIIRELALETAFEGNRFHDLMRIAKRRGDNSYLANKIALKHTDQEGVRAKLMDESNWYLSY